jgi:hypothetical protein
MSSRVLSAVLVTVALASRPGNGAANRQKEQPAMQPGEYEGFFIGLDREGGNTLTGYFSSSTGRGQFSCRFYLKGVLEGAKANVATWLPGSSAPAIKGILEIDPQGGFQLRLESEPDGCGNVQRFSEASSPARFSLLHARPWRWVRVVRSEVAVLHVAPDSKRKGPHSFSRGEGVGGVEERANGLQRWMKIKVIRDGKAITGWLNAEDLYPVSGPRPTAIGPAPDATSAGFPLSAK